MRIKLLCDSATEAEMRTLLIAHRNVIVAGVAGDQPVNLDPPAGGKAAVSIEGPTCYGIESQHLSPMGALHVLAALLGVEIVPTKVELAEVS